MSSVIGPPNPGNGHVPETLEEQVKNLFLHLSAAIKAAGGTPDDFLKIEFWARDQAAGRAALNGEWEKMFPDPDPGRHATRRHCRRTARRNPVCVYGGDWRVGTLLPALQGHRRIGLYDSVLRHLRSATFELCRSYAARGRET